MTVTQLQFKLLVVQICCLFVYNDVNKLPKSRLLDSKPV